MNEQEQWQYCNLWKLMDWHQENQKPAGCKEDETEGDITTQVAEHAEDYANEEPEAFPEQSYELHEDHAGYDEEPAGYSEHHEDHAGGDVQNVLSDDWRQEEQHEDHECHARVEQQEGQDSYGDNYGGEESSYGYHDEEEGYGYEAEDPCYDYYEDNEAW